MTLILRGSRDTIPADILTDLIAKARAGNGRLVGVDEGNGLPARFADAGGFARRDPRMPLVGIRRWFAGSPRRILFIAAGEPHGACRSVAAAIACIVAHETDRDRTVAIATHREDIEQGKQSLPTRWEEVTLPELLLTTPGRC